MTRWSFSTTICHNGGDGFRQREQGYHVSSVGRRVRDSFFSWVTDGCGCFRDRVYHLLYMWYHAILPLLRCFYLHSAPTAIRALRSLPQQEAPKFGRIRCRFYILINRQNWLYVLIFVDYKLIVKNIKKV